MAQMNNADGYVAPALLPWPTLKLWKKKIHFRELNYAICWPKEEITCQEQVEAEINR